MIDAIGKTGKLAIVEGALGTTAQINRTKGFTDELKKSAPGDPDPGQADRCLGQGQVAHHGR